MCAGRQISAREVGLIGSHGNGKLQPFMVAFFRSTVNSSNKQPGHNLQTSLNENKIEDDDDDDEVPLRTGRIRRQASNNNRKRSKENEEFGSWNPYAGILFLNF